MNKNRKILELTHLWLFLLVVALIAAFDNREGAFYIQWAFIPFFLTAIINIHSIKNSKGIGLLGMFTLWCVLSMVWTVSMDYSSERLRTVFLLFLLLIAASEVDFSRHDNIMWCMLVFTIGTCYLVFLLREEIGNASLINLIGEANRLEESVQNLNAVGKASCLIILFSLYEALYMKRKWLYLFLVVFLAVVLLTKSKSALLSTVFGSAFLVFSSGVKRNYTKPILITVFVITIVYYAISKGLLGDAFIRLIRMFEFFTTGDFSSDASTAERWEFILKGLKTFEESPILGYGIGSSYKLLNGTYYHNNYVQLLVETGIVGFGLYCGFFIYILRQLFQRRKNNKIALFLIALIIVILFCDFTNTTYYHKINYVIYAMAISFVIHTPSDKHKKYISANNYKLNIK